MTDEEFRRKGEEEIKAAKAVDIEYVASSMGYTPVHRGSKCILQEHDSCVLFKRTNTYARFSHVIGHKRQGKSLSPVYEGGSTIDFCKNFGNMSTREAIHYLLGLVNYQYRDRDVVRVTVNAQKKVTTVPEERQYGNIKLPEKNDTYRRIYAYLNKSRSISNSVISYFVKEHRLYESKNTHNCVFVTYDNENKPRFACQHGTLTSINFKGGFDGSDKNCAFPVYKEGSDKVIVFEAPIDLMSYMTLFPEEKCSMHALCCLNVNSLMQFLSEHEDIKKVSFSLDNDKWAPPVVAAATEHLENMGYEVVDNELTGKLALLGCKDVNDFLCIRNSQNNMPVPVRKAKAR